MPPVNRRTIAAALALAALVGCRTPRPRHPRPAIGPEIGSRVQKVREDLQVTPLEAVFSAVRGEGPVEETVAIRNTGTEPEVLAAVMVAGDDPVFRLGAIPQLPMTLVPGAQVMVAVTFAPAADATAGVHRAMLKILLGPTREEGPPVDLSGLVLVGKRGEKEPPLQQVLEALGFPVQVGTAELRIGLGAEPLGDELRAPRFRRAGPSPVSLYPVARFSSGERLPYGFYKGEAAPETHPLGAVAAQQDQTLNPELEPDALTTFDPGEGAFGLFLNLGKRYGYTEDRLNTGAIRHAARVYPLKGRTGGRIPDAYAIAFETSGDGDYQDLVFVLWNVKAVEQ
jgi:hypothetical protein